MQHILLVSTLLALLMLFTYIIFSLDLTAPAKPEVANFS